MNNKTIGPAALAAVLAAAGTANAAEPITVGISGYHEQWVGFASNDDFANSADYTSVDVKADAEFFLTGSTKLDNGLTITTVFELEAQQGEDTGDETYITVASDTMGTIRIGADDSPNDDLHHGAPDVGIEIGDIDDWIVVGNTTYADASSINYSDDAEHIAYFSPSFSGFAFAAAYSPDAVSDGGTAGQPDSKNGTGGMWSVVGTYDGEMSGVAVGMDLGFAHQTSTPGLWGWQAGLSLGFDNITLSGGYAHLSSHQPAGVSSTDGYVYDVGVSYNPGPWAVSAAYLYSNMEGDTNTVKNDVAQNLIVSASYTMGPGVDLKGSAFWANWGEEGNTSATENDGMGIVGGMVITF